MWGFSAGAQGDRQSQGTEWSREAKARLLVDTWQEGFQGYGKIRCALVCACLLSA